MCKSKNPYISQTACMIAELYAPPSGFTDVKVVEDYDRTVLLPPFLSVTARF